MAKYIFCSCLSFCSLHKQIKQMNTKENKNKTKMNRVWKNKEKNASHKSN